MAMPNRRFEIKKQFYQQSESVSIFIQGETIVNRKFLCKKHYSWVSTQSMECVTGFQPFTDDGFMFARITVRLQTTGLCRLRRVTSVKLVPQYREPGNWNQSRYRTRLLVGEGTDNSFINIGFMNWGLSGNGRWGPIKNRR
jgi:hypothetical protein